MENALPYVLIFPCVNFSSVDCIFARPFSIFAAQYIYDPLLDHQMIETITLERILII